MTKTILYSLGLASVVGTGLFVYYKGYNAGIDRERGRVERIIKAQEDALDKAQARISSLQNEIKNNVTVKYVDRVKTVTKTKVVNQDVIKEVYKESPFLPKGFVYAHDQLVTNSQIDPEKAADLTPTSYTWENLLNIVAENYSIAQQGRIRNEAWNEFYDGVYHSYDDYRLPNGSEGRNNIPTSATTEGINDTPAGAEEDR